MLDFIHRYETKVEFSRIGHDLSLDFVKGICILLVLVHHTTDTSFHQDSYFYIWGYPAVPLFLLIQVFQTYKSGYEKKGIGLGKTWNRAIFPFIIAEAFVYVCYFALHPYCSWSERFLGSLYWGGKGPGCYYPWIYIQFAILLPLLRPIFRQFSRTHITAFFLCLSIGIELACSMFHVSEWLYRLLFFRYVFLIYLGYEMVERGVALNALTVLLSIVSVVLIYFFEVKDVDWSPWFYYSESWKSFHWICYFYISYPLLFFLCKVFYKLPVNGILENTICKLGRHSYAIYIFQLFYFVNLASFVRDALTLLDNPTLFVFLYIIISVFVCCIPVIRFVSGLSNKLILGRVLLCFFAIFCVCMLVSWKWRPFYRPAEVIPSYKVIRPHDDTLRVIMIGDSWVYFHQTLRRDSTFERQLKKELGSRKVKVIAKGRYGFTSGEIYERMSAERTMKIDYDLNNCTQEIIETGPDYCVISAGINDARQRRGKNYFVRNYYHIIKTLLSNNIRPVVMEIPDVDVDEAYIGNTLYYQLKAKICMNLLKTQLYGVNDYRQALKDSLELHHLMDSIIYVPAASWNPEGWRDKRDIYTDDHFHLNLLGYKILDSTFAAEIVKDYLKRKQ